jgi:hypothetical protein
MDGKYIFQGGLFRRLIMRCSLCGKEVKFENDGLFLVEELLSFEERKKFKNMKKPICVDCKKELFFANIIAVI